MFSYSLSEPWLLFHNDIIVQKTIHVCSDLHLYARILDNAVDECTLEEQEKLLQAQSMFWKIVSDLTMLYPDLQQECRSLIDETVEAVIQDNRDPCPALWGRKNHHLLICPMLLSGNGKAYQDCKPALSLMLCLAQTVEELAQNGCPDRDMLSQILAQVTAMPAHYVELLHTHGWTMAAERIVSDGQKILAFLSRNQHHYDQQPI